MSKLSGTGQTNETDMKRLFLTMAIALTVLAGYAKTLVVYYSYTNNVEKIITELKSYIDCDVVEVEPAENGLQYEVNNYAIGSALIAAIRNNPDEASSYPAIDPLEVDFKQYDTVIIGAPLWWSQMAAPLQTFLFQNGAKMAGKNIGLIVSSASSGISGVESDAKRLIPDGKFIEPSLWIRSSQTSNARSLISQWLKDIDYTGLAASIMGMTTDEVYGSKFEVYSLSGFRMDAKQSNLSCLSPGVYILNNNGNTRKVIIQNH